jgi:hypothetical protein
MKPTEQVTIDHGAPRGFPLTDYTFQATTQLRESSSEPRTVTKLSAFHKLSSEFFGAEMIREQIIDLLIFTLIATVSAWPIISMLHAITRLVRNY